MYMAPCVEVWHVWHLLRLVAADDGDVAVFEVVEGLGHVVAQGRLFLELEFKLGNLPLGVPVRVVDLKVANDGEAASGEELVGPASENRLSNVENWLQRRLFTYFSMSLAFEKAFP